MGRDEDLLGAPEGSVVEDRVELIPLLISSPEFFSKSGWLPPTTKSIYFLTPFST